MGAFSCRTGRLFKGKVFAFLRSDTGFDQIMRRASTIVVAIMTRLKTLAIALALLTTSAYAQTTAVAERIDRILREVPLIDGHNDLPWQYLERVKNHLAQIDLRKDQSRLTPPLHTDIA